MHTYTNTYIRAYIHTYIQSRSRDFATGGTIFLQDPHFFLWRIIFFTNPWKMKWWSFFWLYHLFFQHTYMTISCYLEPITKNSRSKSGRGTIFSENLFLHYRKITSQNLTCKKKILTGIFTHVSPGYTTAYIHTLAIGLIDFENICKIFLASFREVINYGSPCGVGLSDFRLQLFSVYCTPTRPLFDGKFWFRL